MYEVLLIIQLLVTLTLIGIILIQRSATDGLGGMGGGAGGGGGFMTTRAQANLLTRTTAILATVFILNSLALTWLTQQSIRDRSLADRIVTEQQQAPMVVPTPDELITPPVADENSEVTPPVVPEVPKPE